jgi:hypothetical protein
MAHCTKKTIMAFVDKHARDIDKMSLTIVTPEIQLKNADLVPGSLVQS